MTILRIAAAALLLATTCTREPNLLAPEAEPSAPKPDPNGIRKLAVGDGVCMLTNAGVLSCHDSLTLTPERITELGPVDDVWLGPDSACVEVQGSIKCHAADGELPFELDGEQRLVLPTQAEVVDLDWSKSSGCAVTSDGALWCAVPYNRREPMQRHPLADVTEVEVLETTAYARLESDEVRCIRRDWRATIRMFAAAGEMAVGNRYVCVLDERGVPWCVENGLIKFRAITGLPRLIDIEVGNEHACGRSTDGEVWCWGSNEYGQLGDGTTQSNREPIPSRVATLGKVDQLAVGGDMSCVSSQGQVQCWGWMREMIDPIPSEVPGIRATELEMSSDTTCAKVGTGWKCWGSYSATGGVTEASQIVDGTPSRRPGWASCQMHGLRCDGKMFRDDFSCFTKRGEVYCDSEPNQFERIELPGEPTSATAFDEIGCALTGSVVYCWKAGGLPVRANLGEVAELIHWNHQLCARGRAGEVWCWGRYLGPPTPSPEQPISMDLPGPALEVELSNEHGCARLHDGRVFCWGSERSGQRGRVSTQFVLRPQVITFDP